MWRNMILTVVGCRLLAVSPRQHWQPERTRATLVLEPGSRTGGCAGCSMRRSGFLSSRPALSYGFERGEARSSSSREAWASISMLRCFLPVTRSPARPAHDDLCGTGGDARRTEKRVPAGDRHNQPILPGSPQKGCSKSGKVVYRHF